MKKSVTLFYEYSLKYRPRYRLHEDINWRLKGSKIKIPKAYLSPEILNAIGTKPEEMLTSTRYEDEIKRNTVVNYDEFLNWKEPNFKKLLLDQDPNKEIERPQSFLFVQKSRFEFGDLQAALLTKTRIMDSEYPILPEVQLPDNIRPILERFILKAHWWITDEKKFPRRHLPRSPVYKNKVEFGIQPKDSIRYMFNDLFTYCDYLTPSDEMRMFNKDHFIETFYQWRDSRIQFAENRDFLISGARPLKVFREEPMPWSADELELQMRPVDPRIDLVPVRHYSPMSSDGWRSMDIKAHHPHIITVNLDLPNIHTDFLEPEARQITQTQKNSICIMNCFAQGVATARRIFGDAAVDNCEGALPHPICVQAVAFDGVQLDLVCYQLNSTDFRDNDTANVAWIDAGNKLFDKIIRSQSMLRNTRYENLNVGVFGKLLSFYGYGCA